MGDTPNRPMPGCWVDEWRQTPASDLSPGVRLTLYALANYMDRRGVCWPSLATLARDTGYSRRHVVTHIATAEASCWLTVDRQGGPPGRGGRPNLYRAVLRSGEVEFTTSEVVKSATESGEICARSGEVGFTQTSSRTSKEERPQVRAVERDVRRPTHTNWKDILNDRDAWALALSDLDGLIIAEAKWLLAGLETAEAWGVAAGHEDATGLVAVALHDMHRKAPHRWTRTRFVAFLGAAARVRTDTSGSGEDYDYDLLAVIEACWKVST